jgi:hypothetical protein
LPLEFVSDKTTGYQRITNLGEKVVSENEYLSAMAARR